MNDAAGRLEALKKIVEVARLAGIRGQADEQALVFSAMFTLENDRTQKVLVRQTLQAPDGSPVISIMSACAKLDQGWLKGMSKDDALNLLRANEKFPFARFGITKFGGEEMVIASMDLLLDSLDAAEFGTYIWAVARAADAWEATQKHDTF